MSNRFASLFYSLTAIVLLAALALLFFRQDFIDYYRDASGVTKTEVVIRRELPAEQLIDTEILQADAMRALTSQVKLFSIDKICGSNINNNSCRVGNTSPLFE